MRLCLYVWMLNFQEGLSEVAWGLRQNKAVRYQHFADTCFLTWHCVNWFVLHTFLNVMTMMDKILRSLKIQWINSPSLFPPPPPFQHWWLNKHRPPNAKLVPYNRLYLQTFAYFILFILSQSLLMLPRQILIPLNIPGRSWTFVSLELAS